MPISTKGKATIEGGMSNRIAAVASPRKELIKIMNAEEGSAFVEFAVALPLLLTIVLGMFAYGLLMYQKMRVSYAAEAGGAYASMTGAKTFDQAQIDKITAVVTSSTTIKSLRASPAPYRIYGCVTADTAFTEVAAGTAKCADKSSVGTYVVVSASVATYRVLHAFLGHAVPPSFSASVMVRIQ